MVLFHRQLWRDRVGRGGVGDQLVLAIGADGDLGDRKAFAELDQPRLGQKVLLRRALKKIDVEDWS